MYLLLIIIFSGSSNGGVTSQQIKMKNEHICSIMAHAVMDAQKGQISVAQTFCIPDTVK